MGLYVAEADMKALARTAADGEAWLHALLDGQSRVQLRLKFYRNVDKATLVKAIADSVRPRLEDPEAAGLHWLSSTLLDMVTDMGGSVTPGAELIFSWNEKDGTLCLQLDGAPAMCLRSPKLAHALFDVYIGDDPISPEARKNFVEGGARVVAANQ